MLLNCKMHFLYLIVTLVSNELAFNIYKNLHKLIIIHYNSDYPFTHKIVFHNYFFMNLSESFKMNIILRI